MKRRILNVVLALALASTVAGGVLAAQPARAHHFTGTCGEVGIWTKSAAARQGVKYYQYEADAYVGNIPPTADCYDGSTLRSNYRATQHTSLFMRDGKNRCLETVAYRTSSADLYVWGYGCGGSDTSGDRDYVFVGPYSSSYVRLWMKSRATGTDSTEWDHWFWNYDTSQWVYIGFTAVRSGRAYPWAESSGYNATSRRDTHLINLFGDDGTRSTNFPCPETDDFDDHQGQYDQSPWFDASKVKFVPRSNAEDTC